MSDKPTYEEVARPILSKYGDLAQDEVNMIQERIQDNFSPLANGDKIPDFNLKSAEGVSFSKDDILENGLAVISFNRGNLCMFCQMEIKTWKSYLEDLKLYNAKFITISGDLTWADHHEESRDHDNFEILIDKDMEVSKKFGIAYELNTQYENAFEAFGMSMDDFYGEKVSDDRHSLPVPATYLVDQNGTVIYAFIEPDFTKRVEPYEVIREIINYTNQNK